MLHEIPGVRDRVGDAAVTVVEVREGGLQVAVGGVEGGRRRGDRGPAVAQVPEGALAHVKSFVPVGGVAQHGGDVAQFVDALAGGGDRGGERGPDLLRAACFKIHRRQAS